MPEKLNIYRSYGEKLISLFAKLLFSRESHSLTDLSRMLQCSKQTVLRLVSDIQRAYGIEIEEMLKGKQKYYQLTKKKDIPQVFRITRDEMQVLYMCRAFTEHLLGKSFFDDATHALEKSQTLMSDKTRPFDRYFASFMTGYIDYTPHQDEICTLVEAMNEKKICKINYQAIMSKRSKTFYIKPLKIFSHKDTIYVHAQKARTPGKPYEEPDFNPLLALQRFKSIEITDRNFEFPANYDFDRLFRQNFGVIKDETFEVEIEFEGWAANFVAERIWSPDQKIKKVGKNKTRLTFTGSSEPEVISWLLSFGEDAILIKPDWLVKELKSKVVKLADCYK